MHRVLTALFAMVFAVSCTEKLAFAGIRDTGNGKWSKDQAMEFAFSGLDSTLPHQMFITLRNDNQYPFNNLFLIVELNAPDGTSQRDTLEYEMADAEGNWLGSGMGSVRENKLWYRENVVFPDSGVYRVTISHAMRKNGSVEGMEDLPGVLDVGLQIEKKP